MTLALLPAVVNALRTPPALVSCLLSLGLLLCGPRAHAYELKRDAAGSVVRWEGPVQLVVDAQLEQRLAAPGAFSAVQAAVANVQQSLGGLAVTWTEGSPEAVGYDAAEGAHNQSEIVALEDWPYDPESLAVTVVTLDTRSHRIIDADIAFNVAHRSFAVLAEGTSEGGLYDDVQNTLTHELGHALGLAHNAALPDAVMYPSARRGETHKRLLHEDDRAGLAVLYGGALAEEAAAGCSASGTGAALWLLLLVLPLLLRRPSLPRKAAAARALPAALGLLALGGAAHASNPVRQEAPVSEAAVVATTEVVAVRTLPPAPGARLLQSEVEVRVRECLKGRCPERMVLRVPGGPTATSSSTWRGSRCPAPARAWASPCAAAPRPSAPARAPPACTGSRVLSDFSAFARGLGAAGWKGQLRARREVRPDPRVRRRPRSACSLSPLARLTPVVGPGLVPVGARPQPESETHG